MGPSELSCGLRKRVQLRVLMACTPSGRSVTWSLPLMGRCQTLGGASGPTSPGGQQAKILRSTPAHFTGATSAVTMHALVDGPCFGGISLVSVAQWEVHVPLSAGILATALGEELSKMQRLQALLRPYAEHTRRWARRSILIWLRAPMLSCMSCQESASTGSGEPQPCPSIEFTSVANSTVHRACHIALWHYSAAFHVQGKWTCTISEVLIGFHVPGISTSLSQV